MVRDGGGGGNASVGSGTSRRTLLTRGLYLLAGAASVGIAGSAMQPQRDPFPGLAAAGTVTLGLTTPTEWSLFVRDVRFGSPAVKPGELPAARTLTAPHGRLVDAGGTEVGTLSGGVMPGSGGQIAFQRFVFADGTLVGMGSGSLEDEEYAVVGGTGQYAGATGTYLTSIQAGARGRDAEFRFDVTGTKG